MIRVHPLREEDRKAIVAYLRELPVNMPNRIKQIRYVLKKRDLDELEREIWQDFKLLKTDLELLRALNALNVPIGRGKGSDWIDLRSTFVSRHSAAEDAKVIFNVQKKEEKDDR